MPCMLVSRNACLSCVALVSAVAVVAVVIASRGKSPSPLKAQPKRFSQLATGPFRNHYKVATSFQGQVHRGRFFDLDSRPLQLQYSEVHYAGQLGINLPEAIVREFANKTIAITGYEVNIVRRDADGLEEVAPCSDVYNHHYILSFGPGSLPINQVPRPPLAEGFPRHVKLTLGTSIWEHQRFTNATAPASQVFAEGNGNEHRGTFHGLPTGYAQLLHSPRTFNAFLHTINTRMPYLGPWLLPRESPASPTDAYSGLAECPCTDRMEIDPKNGTINGKPPEIPLHCAGELQAQKNPSCSLSTYAGGLRCCTHGDLLLDKAQDTSSFPVDEYIYKFRFWYEPYTTQKHSFRLFWMTETWNFEYDVVACPSARSECVHTLTATWIGYQMFSDCDLLTDMWCADIKRLDPEKGFEIVYAAGHCHAPACISVELINVDTGDLICRQMPVYGTHRGVAMDEEGYAVAIPPCLWGDAAGTPDPPRLLPSVRLLSIAKYNNTVAHPGVMALWQMKGAYVE